MNDFHRQVLPFGQVEITTPVSKWHDRILVSAISRIAGYYSRISLS
jgi:hypothetical protein